ncbi:MAG: hypothetical protein MJ108_00615 [Saccharofermentans sp.]|nr:hypothetical protein [Saccharofermentans sp.]
MSNSIFEMFKIDKLGKRIFVRFLFVLLVAANLFIIFHPIGDSNFDAYIAFMNKLSQNPEMIESINYNDIPLTSGNIKFIASALIVFLAELGSSWLYTGLFIREYRIRKGLTNAISIPKLIFRLIVLTITFVFLITIFSVFVLYLGLIFIIIFPYLAMFPACYLSGDKNLIGSFKGMIQVSRGYYMINSRNISIIVCCYLLCDLVLMILGNINPAARASMVPIVNVFILMSLGRYIGMIYPRMLRYPGGIRIIVTQQIDNDVSDSDEEQN